jgi:hypothetical protein
MIRYHPIKEIITGFRHRSVDDYFDRRHGHWYLGFDFFSQQPAESRQPKIFNRAYVPG